MQEILKFAIGIIFLILGFPLGLYLAKKTKEELKVGQKWFKLIIIISLGGAIISLIIGNDVLLFSFLFITLVTSLSLRKKKRT